MNLNGLEINKIIDDYQIRKIQISGKWIYFYSEKDDALCRIRKDGKSKTIVSTFINSKDRKIYSTKIKSKISKEIIDLKSNKTKINIVNGEIYYLDDSDDFLRIYQMYRIKENGKSLKPIEY